MGKSKRNESDGNEGCFKFKTLAITAFSLTLFEGLAGLICSTVYLLYHNCILKLENDSKDSIGKVLYLKYVVGGDCTWKGADETRVGRYNPNNLTNPDNLVVWQIVYLALYILWVITASTLTKSFKRPNLYLVPWLLATGLIIIADLIFTILALTDLGKEIDEEIADIFEKYQSESTLWLVLYCCKGGIFWLINVVLLVWVLNSLIVYKESSDDNSLWTNKNFDDIKHELSSHNIGERKGYDDLEGTESEPEMVTEFREEEPRKPYHGPATIQPSHQHTHLPNRHNGIGNGVPNSYSNGILNGVPNGYGNGNVVPNGHGNGVLSGYGNGVPNVSGNKGNRAYDNGGFQHEKPKSFKEKIKETKSNKMNVGSGGAYAYISETPVVPQYRKEVPVKDVDSAFGFLSNYDERQGGGGAGGQSNRSEASVSSSKIINGRRVYDDDENGPFYIPKMKI